MAKCNGPKYSRVPAEEWGHRSVHLWVCTSQPSPSLPGNIICHTALKREEKREWRRIASPSPPAHQVRRLNLKHPGLILGGSTGVSLDAHPAHRQPSTSPSARYWAEGPAEGQASGSTLEGHPWDALVRGREGTSISLSLDSRWLSIEPCITDTTLRPPPGGKPSISEPVQA
ncbi:hypothetical protein H109_03056 [Trichophyton interdigitale MR816]|uniref:Uncharacterized protein n=1 Tax=Trichophyton interdigitale (strain MR816) TaxID=1215338 RepID=A0A059JB56_TRIIM|nr:hypothetical protein H109_03056 [Trichophyton interdigitale MR816]